VGWRLRRNLVGASGTLSRARREERRRRFASAGCRTAPSWALREAVPDGDPAARTAAIDGFDPAISGSITRRRVPPAVTVLRFGRGHQTDMTNYLRVCEQIVRDDPRSTILVPATPESLLTEDGAVVGAVVRDADGVVHEVHAESTLLATGGFQADPELRASAIHPSARNLPLRSSHYSNGAGCASRRALGPSSGTGTPATSHLFPAGVEGGRTTTSAYALLQRHAIILNLEEAVRRRIGRGI
jgi:hypothetical protein